MLAISAGYFFHLNVQSNLPKMTRTDFFIVQKQFSSRTNHKNNPPLSEGFSVVRNLSAKRKISANLQFITRS